MVGCGFALQQIETEKWQQRTEVSEPPPPERLSLWPPTCSSHCSRQHNTVSWPADKSPPPTHTLQHPNIQINLSQVLRLLPSSEWPTSSHPSSGKTNVSTRHREGHWLFVLISSSTTGQRAQTRETYHMCRMSLSSRPSFIKKHTLKNKKCDPARTKNPRSYHMRWLESKANTPTGVYTKTDDYRTQGLASTT
ncbi:unnamed protein product [Pleuronectes platessa]|uniref:Uncharacterized protein n=1 Tax=Pleuronectes platessa TaxID=8262 RepID=A0A9N7VU33_PLEPL|nr:unnamed protein product [Pleuronectes platessa]